MILSLSRNDHVLESAEFQLGIKLVEDRIEDGHQVEACDTGAHQRQDEGLQLLGLGSKPNRGQARVHCMFDGR